jgi:hypothetical protein
MALPGTTMASIHAARAASTSGDFDPLSPRVPPPALQPISEDEEALADPLTDADFDVLSDQASRYGGGLMRQKNCHFLLYVVHSAQEKKNFTNFAAFVLSSKTAQR